MPQRIPPVGYPVQHFRTGKDNNAKPAAALVVATYPNGLVDLIVYSRGWKLYEAVPHCDSDKALSDPKWVRETGTWDYIPDMPHLGLTKPSMPEAGKTAKGKELAGAKS